MLFYILIVLISALLIMGANILSGVDFVQAMSGVLGGISIVFLLDLIIAAVIMILPKKLFNPFSKKFRTYAWEKKFYMYLRIKSWKDLIPKGNGIFGFGLRKDRVENPNSTEYLMSFLIENCRAETMHVISAHVGFLIVLFFSLENLSISLPIACVNFVLQVLPVMVQRYLRPKLICAYKRAERSKEMLNIQNGLN